MLWAGHVSISSFITSCRQIGVLQCLEEGSSQFLVLQGQDVNNTYALLLDRQLAKATEQLYFYSQRHDHSINSGRLRSELFNFELFNAYALILPGYPPGYNAAWAKHARHLT